MSDMSPETVAGAPKSKRRRHQHHAPTPADPPSPAESSTPADTRVPAEPPTPIGDPIRADESEMYTVDLDATDLTWQVGVREVQKNFADVLRRLNESGEPAAITNRHRVVAVLQPVSRSQARYVELLASGDITPAAKPGGLLRRRPRRGRPGRTSMSQTALEMREEER